MPHKSFDELSPAEVLMVAIDVEEVNGARLRTFADLFADNSSDAATLFAKMAVEEDEHRDQLLHVYTQLYGDKPRTLHQDDVREVIEAHDLPDGELQVFDGLSLRQALETVLAAELGAQSFYRRALTLTDDLDLQDLFRKLGEFEGDHVEWMEKRLNAVEDPA